MFACGGGKFCYNNFMNKIVNMLKKYMYVVAIFIVVSIILGVSYSNFIVTSNNHKAAEMYIGALKYSIEIDNSSTNTLTIPTGETIIDVKINNLNPVDTYYKLLYLKNSNLTVEYFGLASELDNSNNVTKSYDKPNDSVTSSNSKTIKLQITNNSTSSQTLGLSVKGGYITNTLSDIATPSNYSEIASINTKASTYFCKTNDTLTQGLQYVNGQYTYAYKQEGQYASSGLGWSSISNNGWGVQLTDNSSTDAVTSKVCIYINNKPITSMSYMFNSSQAVSIDISNFNTSNVTNMDSMFASSIATSLDLSNFNTSNVTDMRQMFYRSQATTLDLSSFDTSNVTNMRYMFRYSKATTLDLSNFDTANVTDMNRMFTSSQATSLDLSNFDTSKVTDMRYMFSNIKPITLDLSSFDTSNVTDMGSMFSSSTNLTTIYASDKFNTDNVTASTSMFSGCTVLVGGAGTTYNSSYVDKTYAHIDGGEANPGYFTDIADKDIPAPNSFATDSWKTIAKAARTNNTGKYNVGDTRTIDMGTYGTHTLRVANKSTPSECSTTGFSQSACGFVVEFADIITTHNMNSSYTNVGGWPATSMRTFVNNDIYNALPNELQSAIIDTIVVSSYGDRDSSNFTSTDKLYLLALKEIYTDFSSSYDTAKDLTRTLDYYTAQGVTTSDSGGTIKNNGSSADWWWLRSAYSNSHTNFYRVHFYGGWIHTDATTTYGVSPAFRIG